MADYTIRVEASTDDAEKKLKRVDDQVKQLDKGGAIEVTAKTDDAEKRLKRIDEKVKDLDKGANIRIDLPNKEQVLSGLAQVKSAAVVAGKGYIDVTKALNVGPGKAVNDFQTLFGVISDGGKKGVNALEAISKATPGKILGTSLDVAGNSANSLTKNLANIGFAIFGVTQSVNLLKTAFGGLFDETIGRQVRLQESLLKTRTTLASTADVTRNGQKLSDPYDALIALEKPLDKTLANIRRRSLDIAGTTSDAIVQVFGVVASQVGNFGGTLKDAEDLAITFSGALGTLGLSNPAYASQEIRSILTGTIDQNSILARSLGITNEDIAKAKRSTEGLVGYLTKRLEAFTAGQKIAAQGFSGIVSNIAEVREEASRSLGAPLLAPLLGALTAVYKRLQLVFGQTLSIADGFGRIGSTVATGVLAGIAAAPIVQKQGTDRKQISAFDAADKGIANAAVTVQRSIDSIQPLISRLANSVIGIFAQLSQGLLALAKGFALFKFEQFKILLFTFGSIAALLNSTVVPAFTALLNVYGAILEQPVAQYLSQVGAQLAILERIGVLPFVRLGIYIGNSIGVIGLLINSIKAVGTAISVGVKFALSAVAASIAGITQLIVTAGVAITTGAVVAAAAVLQAVRGAALAAGGFLLKVGVQVQSLGAQFVGLGSAITLLGTSFLNVDQKLDQAGVAIGEFGTTAQQKLDQVGVAGKKAADATRNLGTTLKDKLGQGLAAIGPAIKSILLNFLLFQGLIIGVQLAIGVAVDLYGRFQRAIEDFSGSTKAAQAAQRLSTVYKDLGENASEAAKALRDADKAAIDDRITKLKTKLVEGRDELKTGNERVRQLKKTGNDGNLLSAANFGNVNLTEQEVANANYSQTIQQVDALREGYKKSTRELENLVKVQREFESTKKNDDTVGILARQRGDIEKQIKDFRKNVEKEIKDEQFKTAREVAQLQQSLAENARKQERSELERRLAKETEGLIGARAKAAEILVQAERDLFEAQTEAQRRQFDLAEKRKNLEKEIDNFKFKSEQDSAKLAKSIGNLKKEVANYEEGKARETREANIKAALRVAAINAEKFVLAGSREGQEFQQAANNKGISPTQALALLKVPGNVEKLGVAPDPSNQAGTIDAILSNPELARKVRLPQAQFLSTLENDTKRSGKGAGQVVYDNAADELGNRRFFQKAPTFKAKDLKFEEYAALEKKQAENLSLRERALSRILQLEKDINDIIAKGNSKENINKVEDAFSKNDILTELPSLEAVNEQLAKAQTELKSYNKAFETGTGILDQENKERQEFFRNFKNILDKLIGSPTIVKGKNNKERQENQKKLADRVNEATALVLNSDKGNPQTNQLRANDLKKDIANLTTPTGNAAFKGILSNLEQVNKNLPQIVAAQKLTAQTIKAQEDTKKLNEFRNQTQASKLDLLQGLRTALSASDPVTTRLNDAQSQIERSALTDKQAGVSNDPNTKETRQKEAELLISSAKELGKFEVAIKKATDRLALVKEVSQAFGEGYKNILKATLTGGDVSEAATNLVQGVQDKVLGAFADFAIKPLQDSIEKNLLKFIKVKSPEDILKDQRQFYQDNALADQVDIGNKTNDILRQIEANTKGGPATAQNPVGQPTPTATTTQNQLPPGPTPLVAAQGMTGGFNFNVPTAPVLPQAPGMAGMPAMAGMIGNILPTTKRYPNWNDGVGAPRRNRDGSYRSHQGQDLGVDVGDKFAARMSGEITELVKVFGDAGGAVRIKYQDGTEGTYGHVNANKDLKVGMKVMAGQILGEVTPDVRNGENNTHLHYEQRDSMGRLMNPANNLRTSLAQKPGLRTGTAQGMPAMPATPGMTAQQKLDQGQAAQGIFGNQPLEPPKSTLFGAGQPQASTITPTVPKPNPALLPGAPAAPVLPKPQKVSMMPPEGVKTPIAFDISKLAKDDSPLIASTDLKNLLPAPDLATQQVDATREVKTSINNLADGLKPLKDGVKPLPRESFPITDAPLPAPAVTPIGKPQTPLATVTEVKTTDQKVLTPSLATAENTRAAVLALQALNKPAVPGATLPQTGPTPAVPGVQPPAAVELQVQPFVPPSTGPTAPITPGVTPNLGKAAEGAAAATKGLTDTANSTSASLRTLANGAQSTPQGISSFGQSLGAATSVLGSLALAFGSIQSAQGGGVYGVLTGIAGVLGAAGSVLGAFGGGGGGGGIGGLIGGLFGGGKKGGGGGGGGGGGFGGAGGTFGISGLSGVGNFSGALKRASGGPVTASRAYLVGEQGPEMFYPDTDGQITTSDKTRQMMSNMAGGGGAAAAAMAAMASKSETIAANQSRAMAQAASPENVKLQFAYQAEVINDVEYVTSDQFRKGMADSAERGKSLAFQALQNNVSARRRIGI